MNLPMMYQVGSLTPPMVEGALSLGAIQVTPIAKPPAHCATHCSTQT